MRSDLKDKKIGIVGGTFNPIHLGHLRSAEENREAFDLFRVIFVPSAEPPHKAGNIIDAKHRYRMVKRAIAANHSFSASDLEIKRGGKSYTIDTLIHYKELVGETGEIYFIIGLDAFREIGSWMRFRELFEYAHFVVTDRPDAGSKNPKFTIPGEIKSAFKKGAGGRGGFWTHTSGSKLYFQDISALDISSTTVRRLVKEGRSISYLVPESVEKYINKRGLYR
ncbi:MAG: nicotinate-nucleotide adenylyltransferase [Deltaproteobacteria bacterium]|uniref:Probable nicotinate-nucleotide adenylyltransferase n=1 Tax=Candidatus Zymogenus saltonus TaxID=2844893 RepID=A0A9D8KAW3_9DELT|nr:nicotinate-nucleotide adenylyltransferase [Candidatus Zymogenus saltonus]